MKLDYDNPEVQRNVFNMVADLCAQHGLTQASNFMQSQAALCEVDMQENELDKWLEAQEVSFVKKQAV